MKSLLSLPNLRTQFSTDRGQVRAADGLDLMIGKGEMVGLVGESGPGKNVTTLSAMGFIDDPGGIASGLVELESGRLAEEFRKEYNNPAFVDGDMVNLVGTPGKTLRVTRGCELDMTLQGSMISLDPPLTVGEQVAENLRFYQHGERRKDSWSSTVCELLPRIGHDIDDEIVEQTIEVFESVGIPEPGARVDEFPHEFSGGMCQCVLIVTVFACQPHVPVAGEPTTAFNVTIQARILDLIDGLQEDFGMSVLMITHNLGAVVETCDQAVVMHAGGIVGEGPVEKTFHSPSHPYTYTLIESLPSEDKERLTPIEGNVPDLIDMPEGCHFAPQCPWAQPERTSGEIPYKQHGNNEVDRHSECILDDFDTSEYGGDAIETSTSTEPPDTLLLEVGGMQKYCEQADGILDRFFGTDDRSVRAVGGVDFTVCKDETSGLVGESGCGKSTAGQSLLHLMPSTDGRVVLSGTDLSGFNSDELRMMRRDIQMISQDPMSSLDPWMTVDQAIHEPFGVHDLPESGPNVRGEADVTVMGIDAERVSVTAGGEIDVIVSSSNGVTTTVATVTVADGEVDVAVGERFRIEVEVEHEGNVISGVIVHITPDDSISECRRRRVRQLLDAVGLEPGQYDRYPHELSGSQRQRVGIARALAVNLDFIVADEPVSVLDASVQAQILNLLEDPQECSGLTHLFIAHDLSVVRYISDRVAVVYLGEIIEVATANELFDDPRHLYTQALLSMIPEPDLAAEADGRIILEGDVPSPTNPPSGCHFRTRCPQVIPPADLGIKQAAHHKVMDLRQRVERKALDVETTCDATLDAGDPGVGTAVNIDGGTTDTVVDEPRGSYLSHSLSPELQGAVDRALGRIVAGDQDEADEIFHERFESACERNMPEPGEQTHPVVCYLVDE